MWFLNAIDRLIEHVFCKHQWVFEKRIKEQNLRGGYSHFSNVLHCTRCRKMQTLEIPSDHP